MSIEFKTKLDFKAMKENMLKRQEERLGQLIKEAASGIKQRTAAGQDYQGKQFTAYTKEYRDAKIFATGRGSQPDLIGFRRKRKDGEPSKAKSSGLGGEMLASIRTEIKRVGLNLIGRIFFSDPKQGAKAIGNMKKRKWFLLSEAQKKYIADEMEKIKL